MNGVSWVLASLVELFPRDGYLHSELIRLILEEEDLRRSAITNWAARLPIHVVRRLAGHSDIAATRKYYLAVRQEDVISAISR